MPASKDLTQVLDDLSAGDRDAVARLLPVVYDQLRRLAEQFLSSERNDHTLQATALVHEVFLKLVGQENARWQNRAQFFGVAALAMRRILVDYARAHLAEKRGGRRRKLSLEEVSTLFEEQDVDLVALDEALTRLSEIDAQQGRLVELRFFGGMTIEEAAVVLGSSPATVKREWTVAKAWLYREMSKD